jgi:hypothetical protein
MIATLTRRECITLLGGAAVGWPLAATATSAAHLVAAFRQGLTVCVPVCSPGHPLSGHKEFQGLQRGVAFYFSFFQQAVLSNLKILSSLPSFTIRSSDAILSSLFTLILVKSPYVS